MERERDASACVRRHQAFALPPVEHLLLVNGPATSGAERTVAAAEVISSGGRLQSSATNATN